MSMPNPPISGIVVPKEGFDEETLAKIKTLVTPKDFLKISNLSAASREKLKDYWVNFLGYPADYAATLAGITSDVE